MPVKPIGKRLCDHMMKAKASPKVTAVKQEQRWQRESDLRTLREAEAVRADKARLAGARAEAQAQMKALGRVAKGDK